MISIIIPFYNEKESLPMLHGEILEVFRTWDKPFEVVFVDDGSTDGSLADLPHTDKNVIVVRHRKRFGKGRALRSGLKAATGDIIVFMDGDLQDDPADIPNLHAKLEQGYDLVNGIRSKRKDNPVIRLYSGLVNRFLRLFMKSPFTDINCGFKMMRKEVTDEVELYGNNFRFLPLAAYYQGFRVSEISVGNRVRAYGKSKYGIMKLFIGIIDTLTAYFLYRFSERPLHFFGIIGGSLFSAGFVMTVYFVVERLFFGMLLYRRPALQFAILLIIVGLQIVMTGIIGELIVYLHNKEMHRKKQ